MRSIFSSEEVNVPYWVMELYGKVNADSVEQVEIDSQEYQKMMKKCWELRLEYPVLSKLLEGYGPIRIRKDDHWAFHEYVKLKRKMEHLERMQIYQSAFVHCYECMRKMGVLKDKEDE